jgi:hypothetical protein
MKEWGGWATRNWSWKSRYLILTWPRSTPSGCGTSGNRRKKTAVFPMWCPPYWQRYPADPPWGTACVVIPWNLYLYYDDERILEENYRLVKGWVDYLSSISVRPSYQVQQIRRLVSAE